MEPEVSVPAVSEDTPGVSYEVDFALVLARMINAAKRDPVQLRSSIYELARIKLRREAVRGSFEEKRQLMKALEIAIQGVESFAQREEQQDRSSLPGYSLSGPTFDRSNRPLPPTVVIEENVTTAVAPPRVSIRRAFRSTLLAPILRLGALAVILLGLLAFAFSQLPKRLQETANRPAVPPNVAAKADPSPATVTPAAQAVSATPASAASPPLPSVYGIYALSGGELQEIHALPGQVPDKRVAISASIIAPSRTSISDGKVSFLVFRRDMATNAPDKVDVRVVAQVARTISYDATGKAKTQSAADSWNVRNISYLFRVAPVAANPEMLSLKSEDPDLVLSPGRYMLVLKGQGFDFTVAGAVTDPGHCLERVEASNGSFYAACRAP